MFNEWVCLPSGNDEKKRPEPLIERVPWVFAADSATIRTAFGQLGA